MRKHFRLSTADAALARAFGAVERVIRAALQLLEVMTRGRTDGEPDAHARVEANALALEVMVADRLEDLFGERASRLLAEARQHRGVLVAAPAGSDAAWTDHLADDRARLGDAMCAEGVAMRVV